MKKNNLTISFSKIFYNGHYKIIYDIFKKLNDDKIININMFGKYENSDIIFKIKDLDINIINYKAIIYNIYYKKLDNKYIMLNDYAKKDFFIDYKYSPYSFKFNDNKIFDDSSIWIVKENLSYGGIGIKILKYKDLNKNIYDKDEYIIQKYLENPLLYDGKKVDLRIHFLILPDYNNDKNFKVYLSKLIIVRYPRNKFNLYNLDIKNHLTNFSIYNEKNIKKNKPLEDNHFELSQLFGKDFSDRIYKQIKRKFKHLFKNKILKILNNYKDVMYHYFFALHCLDVLIDDKEKIYFIDYNINPGMEYININEQIKKMLNKFIYKMLIHYKYI